jgi:hypothetical protein
MRTPGVPEELYVRARSALLDAAEALGPHLGAVVLVGAQAIYVHTGDADLAVAEYTTDADLAVAPYTTDADFAVSPVELADEPLLESLLAAADFQRQEDPGRWRTPDGIYVDIMVAEALAGPGTRGARLGPHGKQVARRAKGLEGALVDRDRHTIASLDPSDDREMTMWVAGPGALLVAKVHKIAERVDHKDRVRDKDALDVLRLLRAVETDDLATRLRTLLGDDIAGPVTTEAIELVPGLFGNETSEGVAMAVRAAGAAEDPITIAASLVALVDDLRASLG